MVRFLYNMKLKHVLIFIILFCICVFIFKKCGPCHCSNGEFPVLIWWTPFIKQKRIIDCGDNFKCLATINRSSVAKASAFMFYGSNLNFGDLPLPRNAPWAIFHEESPKNLAFFLHQEGQRFFNVTSTFSRNSDMPLTLQYIKDIDKLTDKKYYISLKKKNEMLKDLAPVLYLQSSCDTPIGRDAYVSELMKYIKIDSYGQCLNNKKLPEALERGNGFDVFEENLLKFEARYKFIISIENAVCDDYITEKLWRPLMLGSIPIYLGSPSIRDWLPNAKSAILINEFKSIEEVAKLIHDINNNDTLYEEYLQHKLKSAISNKYLLDALSKGNYGIQDNEEEQFMIENFECMVCKSVHTGNFPLKKNKSVFDCTQPPPSNSWFSHWTIGKCQIKVLDYFINELKLHNYTHQQFEKLYLEYFTNNNC